MTLETARTAGLVAMAVGQTAFMLLYLFWPWWTTFLGRALFFKAAAFAILLDVALTGRLLGWQYKDEVFVTLYWILAIAIWAQFFAFLRVKVEHREGVSGNHLAGKHDD